MIAIPVGPLKVKFIWIPSVRSGIARGVTVVGDLAHGSVHDVGSMAFVRGADRARSILEV